ncbi:MAG: malate:quinone oxidoreductase, partial [Methylotenera sp. 24-45-7]
KFLKQGSYLDLFKSVKTDNLKPLLGVARHNFDLTRYLVGEAVQTHKSRMQSLRQYYPQAKAKDWHLESAGKRVQIIKECDNKGGKLEFGTEIVSSADGTIAALLGASPGASVSVQAMINVIERCFSNQIKNADWQQKMQALVPSYGESLVDNAELLAKVRARTLRTLKLG